MKYDDHKTMPNVTNIDYRSFRCTFNGDSIVGEYYSRSIPWLIWNIKLKIQLWLVGKFLGCVFCTPTIFADVRLQCLFLYAFPKRLSIVCICCNIFSKIIAIANGLRVKKTSGLYIEDHHNYLLWVYLAQVYYKCCLFQNLTFSLP
jgi:hypothetical protein